MPFNTVALNQALDGLTNFTAPSITPANLVGFASLHSAFSLSSPLTAELTGGTPAYARKAVVWSAAGSGSKATSASVTFDVPPLSTVAFVGLWSVGSAGTASTQFAGMGANGGATQYAFTAAASTDTITAPGSSYTVGDTVVAFGGAGATLPTGLVAGTIYYVKTVTGTAITLSATSGGATLDITADGAGIIQKIVTEVFNAQGTFTLTTDTLTIA